MLDPTLLRGTNLPPNAIWLDSLNLDDIYQPWALAQAGKTVDGKPIVLHGQTYEHGVGTHIRSEMSVDLKGAAIRFVSMVGVGDDRPPICSVSFEVWLDGELVVKTEALRTGDEAELIDVDLIGAWRMVLVATDAGEGILHGFACWAGAQIYLDPESTELPETVKFTDEAPLPIASTDFSRLGIHGPRIIGGTPGREFIFRIPATGDGPLTFSAENLPDGLSLDPITGIISGSLLREGETVVNLTVTGRQGSVSRKLKIVTGQDKLALTPPMGWNSWNAWACAVDDSKVRAAADFMVNSGLASFGFQYVNIDDCWEGERDSNGEILTNEKFPDMNALADYVHSRGLKIGIYSGPGPKTCGGFEASYQHEEQDALTYARWGMDYLKYDWCYYAEIAKDHSREEFEKPYRIMHEALGNTGRDIVYSLCNAGEGQVWEWGDKVGGNLWRVTPDINDSWGSVAAIAFTQNGREVYSRPGRWNDLDMLVVGKVGWGPDLHQTRLTPNEQITHITAWALLASPLLIGCDMSDMDRFTIDLLTNEEVLDVNQDPLGEQAGRIKLDMYTEVWARKLWDDTLAVGLFNRGPEWADVGVNWTELGLEDAQPVRDLWQNRDLGVNSNGYTVSVPPHGVMLVKIGRPSRTDW